MKMVVVVLQPLFPFHLTSFILRAVDAQLTGGSDAAPLDGYNNERNTIQI
jgi:hypothetical protein